MDLFEYQGKQYFARFGIPVSAGGVAELFTPGSSMTAITEWLSSALAERERA